MFTERPTLPIRSHASRSRAAVVGRSLVVAVAVCCTVASTGALAAHPAAHRAASPVSSLGAPERRAIERTIRQQLAAFGRDDADRAFAYATPDLRRRFGTPDRFLDVVREDYEPVYRATGVHFVRLSRVDRQWVQAIVVTDEAGRVWRVLFTMHRQPDRRWKVGGCRIVETGARAT